MTGPVLSVPSFGGGVVLEGSPDSQRVDELSACDSYDLGPRGHLVAASDVTDFANLLGGFATQLAPIYGMTALASPQQPLLVFLGRRGTEMHANSILPNGTSDVGTILSTSNPLAGFIATFAVFPYVDKDGVQQRVTLMNLGARSFQEPNDYPGLWVGLYDGSSPFQQQIVAISNFDALGTGPMGEFGGGTMSRQLAFRGVIAYNNHAFGWGFDSRDTTGDGPNRIMFSNIGNPLKWGRDPQEQAILDGDPETDRLFEDSDAIELGGSGDAIRAACVWAGKLWVGTNTGLYYVEGFGRESFRTNGSLPMATSRNVIGPHAMIEGPDRLLYGVSDEGLWRTNGGEVHPVGDKLRDFGGFSNGWWDLIWTDALGTALAYPGRTNQDLVWMLNEPLRKQVWVVIPYCDSVNGYGYGLDTVVIKYHTQTGGFTRQVFLGQALTAGTVFKREAVAEEQIFVCDSADTDGNVKRYGYKATHASSPVLPTEKPTVTFGPYAPFGPNGTGVMRRKYLTIAWQGDALPLVFSLTITIDGKEQTPITLTIGPGEPSSPADGDRWVDTSGTDTNIGNLNAGTIIPADPGRFLVKRYKASWSKWVTISSGGQHGTRVTIPIGFPPSRGTRFTMECENTAASDRFQVENFSDRPAIVRQGL